MKRNYYIKPEIIEIPMSLVAPIATSMSTDMQLGKEHDFGEDYNDFMSSYERGKEIDPLSED